MPKNVDEILNDIAGLSEAERDRLFLRVASWGELGAPTSRSDTPSPDYDIELVETCSACPEQYDAFLAGEQVGYLRLRHGVFRVSAPTHGGETLYEGNPKGDGAFEPEEREWYLSIARQAISNWLKNRA